ncbi:G/U mismatch-specific uracil-DNA glycosylase [Zymomonas mobilis]|uniref:G/U mismatch-specific uracil-DNA glycosylase n=2 Tax=Zymomonas mobilis TaxID=542 RepID=A0A542W2U9_ZYMMB|nr:G/U mismatch-specific uracil-DNA glycosylase [Zymomonas mobilis]
MLPDPMLRCFAPVTDAHTRLLILGSLPGGASLEKAQYYGHPRNQFWRLIGDIIGEDIEAAAYPERLATLLRKHIGLWDVIGTAKRQGSLDSNIRDVSPNPLGNLIDNLPHLKAIAFNGQKAGQLGIKELQKIAADLPYIILPSSSPAHAVPYAVKRDAWITLQKFILE